MYQGVISQTYVEPRVAYEFGYGQGEQAESITSVARSTRRRVPGAANVADHSSVPAYERASSARSPPGISDTQLVRGERRADPIVNPNDAGRVRHGAPDHRCGVARAARCVRHAGLLLVRAAGEMSPSVGPRSAARGRLTNCDAAALTGPGGLRPGRRRRQQRETERTATAGRRAQRVHEPPSPPQPAETDTAISHLERPHRSRLAAVSRSLTR